jgi:hypothetical protein
MDMGWEDNEKDDGKCFNENSIRVQKVANQSRCGTGKGERMIRKEAL